MWNGSRSGLKINLECEATLPGLLGAGACSKNEATGTHSSAGIPTAYAMNTGFIAGDTAGRQARDCDAPSFDQDVIAMLADHAMSPLRRSGNGWDPDRLHTKLAHMEASVVDLMHLNATKLESKIAQTFEVSELISGAHARHLHDLVKLHEAASVAENARMVYTASLDRTESREQFYREDYPETDNSNWFCWHGVTRTASGPVFDRQRIPVELLPFSAVLKTKKQVSPIHAIFSGEYVPEHYS